LCAAQELGCRFKSVLIGGGGVAYKWIQTKHEGIRYREHESRRNGIRKDRYYAIRYRVEGKRHETGLGWESQGWSLERVRQTLENFKLNVKTGVGPRTMAESRQVEEQARKDAENKALAEKQERITLSEYWPTYIEYAKTKKEEESWEKEQGHYNNWLSQVLDDVPLRDLSDLVYWDKLMNVLIDANLKPRTRNYIALTLHQCVTHAYVRKLVPLPPPRLKDAGATYKPDSNRRTRVISDSEFSSILSNLKKESLCAYKMTLFAAMTCCRAIQVYSLKWTDVNFEDKYANVKEKNHVYREVHLSDFLINMLREMEKVSEYVFVNDDGNPYTQAPSTYETVVDKLGLNEGRRHLDKVVFHSLRHTGATKLGKVVPTRVLMDTIGWRTASMALRYQHTEKDMQIKAANSLQDMVIKKIGTSDDIE